MNTYLYILVLLMSFSCNTKQKNTLEVLNSNINTKVASASKKSNFNNDEVANTTAYYYENNNLKSIYVIQSVDFVLNKNDSISGVFKYKMHKLFFHSDGRLQSAYLIDSVGEELFSFSGNVPIR